MFFSDARTAAHDILSATLELETYTTELDFSRRITAKLMQVCRPPIVDDPAYM